MGSVFVTIKQLFCSHEHLQFMINLYGDKINYYSGKYGNGKTVRSLWRCKNCGAIIGKEDLNGEED